MPTIDVSGLGSKDVTEKGIKETATGEGLLAEGNANDAYLGALITHSTLSPSFWEASVICFAS